MTANAKLLELTVSNFGPIAEASIQLRPMSVFVGPSNTGKPYMAVLIYALHRFFSTVHRQSFNSAKKDAATISDWAREIHLDLQRSERDRASLIELPESIAALVRCGSPLTKTLQS